MTNPYDTLGIPTLAPLEVAKAAYRRLAQQYHPDRDGGNEEKFKAIKAAFETIEAGWTPEPAAPVHPTYTSSFTDPKQPTRRRGAEPPPKTPHAGKPAPGYEARGRPPPLPRARPLGNTSYRYASEYEVDLTCTVKQAFEGCTIPFVCGDTVIQYEVRPGAPLMQPIHTDRNTYPRDDMIGARPGDMLTVTIRLKVTDEAQEPLKQKEKPVPSAPHDMTVRLCALGLFTGGKITVNDYLNEPVSFTIEPGYDPSKPIIVPNKGYGSDIRGDLRIKIEPVFKVPSALNHGERQQLARLNEMVK